MNWPLIGVEIADIEKYLADTIEIIAISARVYELFNFDPNKHAIPVFFYDDKQEGGINDNGRITTKFPYFTLQKINQQNQTIFPESCRSEWIKIKRFNEKDLFKYWNKNGSCYLSDNEQKQLLSAENLVIRTLSNYSTLVVNISMYNNSATYLYITSEIFRTQLYNLLLLQEKENVNFTSLQASPQQSYIEDSGNSVYHSSFDLTLETVTNCIEIKTATITTRIKENIEPNTKLESRS